MGAFVRALRTVVPLGAMVLSGVLQAHPKTVWVLPVLAATGKGIRDTWPNSPAVNYMPF